VNGWGAWFTIVGVAKDSKYNHLAEAPMPYFYVPFRQVYRADMSMAFYVRTKANLNEALASVRYGVRDIDPNVAILDAVPLSRIHQRFPVPAARHGDCCSAHSESWRWSWAASDSTASWRIR